MKKILSFLIFLSLFAFFLSFCAQQGSLSGGPKDTIPPHIVKQYPNNFDTSFLKNVITIKFDEFFTLNNIQQNFFISPPYKKKPKFKIKGKKLFIHLPYKLQDSSTFWITIDNTVGDYTENNKVDSITLVFSNYNHIDCLKISGYLKNLTSLKDLPQLTVVAFRNSDSLPLHKFPDYLAKTDSNRFYFNYLKSGKYKLLVFNDLNGNFVYDGFPENIVGFIDTNINPFVITDTIVDTLKAGSLIQINDTITDTLSKDSIFVKYLTKFFPKNIIIPIFENYPDSQFVRFYQRNSKFVFSIKFNKPLENNFFELNNFKNYHINRNAFNDSLTIFLLDTNAVSDDSVAFFISYLNNNNLIRDTIYFDIAPLGDTLPLSIKLTKNQIIKTDSIILTSENPIAKFDTSKIKLFVLLDTLVSEDKIIHLQISRPFSDKILISISDSIIDFLLKINQKTDTNSFKTKFSAKKIEVKIFDDSLKKQDTLQIWLKIKYPYFFNTSETKIFTLNAITEKINFKSEFISNKNLQITFNKPIRLDSVLIVNLPKNKYTTQIFSDTIKIQFFKTIYDTLHIAIFYEYQGKKICDTIKTISAYIGNPIKKISRYAKHKVRIVFHKPLMSDLKVVLLNGKNYKNWYKLKFLHNNKDTAYLLITNNRVKRLKKLHLALSWYDISPTNDTVYFADTFWLKIEKRSFVKQQAKKTSENQDLKKITVKKSVEFQAVKDMFSLKIISDFSENHKYIIQLDSNAISDIYGKTNDTIKFNFEVIDTSQLYSLTIKLKNVGILEKDSSLHKSQLIIEVFDKKDLLAKTETTTDSVIVIKYLNSGDYKVKVYQDKNKDRYWTNGNLEAYRQPEPIWQFDVNLTENKELEIDFDTELKNLK